MPRQLPEWIGETPDTPVPPRVKLRVFTRFGGRCPICTRRIGGNDRWDTDHKIAIINDGENRENNLQPVCLVPCHRDKSRAEMAEKSRTYEVRAAHVGAKRKQRTITGWRRFNGQRVYAPRER